MGWEWIPVVGLLVLDVKHQRLLNALSHVGGLAARDKKVLVRVISEDTELIKQLIRAHTVTGLFLAAVTMLVVCAS